MKWIKCELHNHTIASDGDMLPHELVENALSRKYDAIGVTDHNTDGCCDAVIAAAKKTNLVVIPGIEWTTFWGHVVALGGNSDVDWRSITFSNLEEKIERASSLGDAIIIAHPKRLGSPFCSECRFIFDMKDYTNVAGYEVWSHYNPPIKDEAKQAKEEWTNLIKEGYKIAPVYGYDWHTRDEGGPSYAMTYIGVEGDKPTNEDIIDAIKKGRTYISCGVELIGKLTNSSSKEFFPGEEIKTGKYTLKIAAKVHKYFEKNYGCQIKGLRMYKNEKVFYAKKWEGEEITCPLSLLEKGTFRVEVYGKLDGNDCDLVIVSPYYII